VIKSIIKLACVWVVLITVPACGNLETGDCNYITGYYQTIYQAQLAYELEEFEKAYNLYKTAFSACNPISTPTYNEIGKYAEVAARLGHNDVALSYITKKIRMGSELKWILQDSVFADVFKTEEGEKLIDQYKRIREEYVNSINIELRVDIQEMSHLDQLYRDSDDPSKVAKQDSIDSLNTKRLIEIFETYGYPNQGVLGHNSIDGIPTMVSTMLLHTEDSIRMNYFVPKMNEFVANGTCDPTVLGSMIDQFHLYNGDPQIYGTYRGRTSRYANMISNRGLINENRKEIGLPPLELAEKIDSLKKIKYPDLFPTYDN